MSVRAPKKQPQKQPKPKPHSRVRTIPPIASQAEFISRHQAAALCSVDIQTIDKWIDDGRLRAFKPDRKVLIRKLDLLQMVEATQK